MDAKIINPFLEAAINVISTMAMIKPEAGKPFLKQDVTAIGDVSGIIGITGAAQGSMSISFETTCIAAICGNMLGMTFDSINDDVRDAVGEMTNMICGDARRRLESDGVSLQSGTPTVVDGTNHSITHIHTGPCLAVPFTTPSGKFVIEVAFNN